MTDQLREYLAAARDREQEAEGLLRRALRLTQEADEFRAKAAALLRELPREVRVESSEAPPDRSGGTSSNPGAT